MNEEFYETSDIRGRMERWINADLVGKVDKLVTEMEDKRKNKELRSKLETEIKELQIQSSRDKKAAARIEEKTASLKELDEWTKDNVFREKRMAMVKLINLYKQAAQILTPERRGDTRQQLCDLHPQILKATKPLSPRERIVLGLEEIILLPPNCPSFWKRFKKTLFYIFLLVVFLSILALVIYLQFFT